MAKVLKASLLEEIPAMRFLAQSRKIYKSLFEHSLVEAFSLQLRYLCDDSPRFGATVVTSQQYGDAATWFLRHAHKLVLRSACLYICSHARLLEPPFTCFPVVVYEERTLICV